MYTTVLALLQATLALATFANTHTPPTYGTESPGQINMLIGDAFRDAVKEVDRIQKATGGTAELPRMYEGYLLPFDLPKDAEPLRFPDGTPTSQGPFYFVSSTTVYANHYDTETESVSVKPLEEADLKTFTLAHEGLHYVFAKDAKHVFFGEELLEGIDPATFSIHEYEYPGTYIQDKDHMYRMSRSATSTTSFELMPVDLGTFSIIQDSPDPKGNGPIYAKDKNHFYCSGDVIAGIDATTATMTRNGTKESDFEGELSWMIPFVKDKNGIYPVSPEKDFCPDVSKKLTQ